MQLGNAMMQWKTINWCRVWIWIYADEYWDVVDGKLVIFMLQYSRLLLMMTYRVWGSVGGARGLWTWRSGVAGDPMPPLAFTMVSIARWASFLNDCLIGDALSMVIELCGWTEWMSITRISAIRCGEGGGVLEPSMGSWLSVYFLLFCRKSEGWSVGSKGTPGLL